MRKFFCILLAMALTTGLYAPVARAAETPTVSISSGTVSPGEEVTLTVSIRDNPGISSTVLHIYFDTSVFQVNPDQDLGQIGGFNSGMVVGNTIAVARANGYTDCPPGKDGVLLGWFNGTGMNVLDSGEMFTVTFHASSEAKAGEYKIELGYSQENTCNEQDEEISLSTILGTVTVTGDGKQSAGSNPSEPSGTPSGKPDSKPGTSSGKPGSSETAEIFSDVAGNWAETYIKQAADRGLIVGHEGKYRPKDSMTRAELVTILWRASGSPKAEPSTFTDLTQDWYKDAVSWAEKAGVIKGVGGGRFGPAGHVTREQLSTILHRMAGSPTGLEGMLTNLYDQQFGDSNKLSDWSKTSVYWTYYAEILCGNEQLTVEQKLDPQADATRAQIAVMIVRYLDRQEKGD